MVLKRGSNTGSHPGTNGRVPAVYDFASLDDLGPETRAAIVNGPLAVLAYPVLKQILDYNEKAEQENEQRAAAGQPLKAYLDPKDPKLDAFLAKNVLRYNVDVMCKDRELEFALAGVVPLKPRYNPKTERDQRRLRRIRW